MSIEERINKILENNKINVVKDDVEILKQLENIIEKKDVSQIDEKTLDKIEEYLNNKEKIISYKEDMEYLKNLAENLRNQNIRVTDYSNPTMFKIKDSLNNEIFFLTRESLEKYKECNKIIAEQIIKIDETSSYELAHLLEIIKRNF